MSDGVKREVGHERGRDDHAGDTATSRADLLKRAVVAAGAAGAGSLLVAGLPSLASSAPSRAQDVRIMNYLLRLEYLKAAFYERARADGGLSGELSRFADVVGQHEREHVEILRRRLGGDAIPEPTFEFGDTTAGADKFAATARTLEELATAAYIGQGANFTPRLMVAAARIASVEARHAAWIADVLGRHPAPFAADPAKSPREVTAAITKTGFVAAS
jgi:Ferritin-like domain